MVFPNFFHPTKWPFARNMRVMNNKIPTYQPNPKTKSIFNDVSRDRLG